MIGRSKQLFIIALLLYFTLLISGCLGDTRSTNNANSTDGEADLVESSSSLANNVEKDTEVNEAGTFPRTISDAEGEVTISTKPERIAMVHWGLSDILLTFDLSSLGIALPFTYEQSVLNTDVYKPYLDKIEDLVIVGENTNVNLEVLLDYEPDLILAGSDMNKEIRSELTKIAQTVFIDEIETNVWQDWRAVMTMFGEILGQAENAQKYISDFDKKIIDAKDKLTTINGTVAFVQVREEMMWLQGSAYLPQYYEELGLKAPDASDTEQGGQISLEGLSELDPDHLFLGYFNFVDHALPAITDEWEKSEVWKKLKSVQNDQAHPINGELALGYGPIGKSYGIDVILEALE